MILSFKAKIIKKATAHPRLVAFGIGMAITFVIGTAIEMVEPHQAFAGGTRWGA